MNSYIKINRKQINIINQFKINLTSLLSNKKQVIGLLSFPLISFMVPTILFPLIYTFPIIIFVSTVFPSGLFYIFIVSSWRVSTLFQNQFHTKVSKLNFYISSFLSMLIVGMFLFIVTFILLSIGGIFDLLTTFTFKSALIDGRRVLIWESKIIPILYDTFLLMIIMFCFLYLLQNIFSSKIIYMIMTALLILDVLYGGTLNGYFIKYHCKLSNGTTGPKFLPYAFGESFYMPTLMLFPFAAPGQQLSYLGSSFTFIENSDGSLSRYYLESGTTSRTFFIWLTNNNVLTESISDKQIFYWNILWVVPYVWIFILFVGGVCFSSKK